MSSFVKSLNDKLEKPLDDLSKWIGTAANAPLMWEPRTEMAVPLGVEPSKVNPHIREGFLRREDALLTLACRSANGSEERAAYAEALWKFRTLRTPPMKDNALPADEIKRTGLFQYATAHKDLVLLTGRDELSETM
jgi:hypothetical protein